ncbi:MAG: hypothetical protein ABSH36_05120 [Solirubrobacteraceae bacterium]
MLPNETMIYWETAEESPLVVRLLAFAVRLPRERAHCASHDQIEPGSWRRICCSGNNQRARAPRGQLTREGTGAERLDWHAQ